MHLLERPGGSSRLILGGYNVGDTDARTRSVTEKAVLPSRFETTTSSHRRADARSSGVACPIAPGAAGDRSTGVPPPSYVRSLRRFARGLVALDMAVMAASFALTWGFWQRVIGTARPPGQAAISLALASAPVLTVVWMVALALAGSYHHRHLAGGSEEFRRAGRGTFVAALVAATGCFLFNIDVSRAFLLGTFLVGAPLLLSGRAAARTWLQRRRLKTGAYLHRVLAAGSPSALEELAETLQREKHVGYRIVACVLTDRPDEDAALPAPVVGSIDQLTRTATNLGADSIMVTAGADLSLREIAWELEGTEIDLVVVPRVADVAAARLRLRPLAGLPLLHVGQPQAARAAQWPKRIFDVVGAGTALILAAPLMLVIAALIKLHDGGPVLYRQPRVGVRGRRFGCWKFRSMAVDAEQIEAELRAHYGHEGALFKLEHDPRITPIGRLIRRYSLDELPQLFNVLDGTMSLVGPRPQQQWEVDTYTARARRRLHVRPGMTGLWQVSGRSRLSWEDAIRLDLYYRDNWSMSADMLIIAKTVRAVLRRDGAY